MTSSFPTGRGVARAVRFTATLAASTLAPLSLIALSGCSPEVETLRSDAAAPRFVRAGASMGTFFADMARRHPAPNGMGGNIDRAESDAAARPDDPAAQRNLGLAYYAAAGYLPAAKTLERAVAKSPNDGLAWLYLGFSRLANDEVRGGIDALKTAVARPELSAAQKAAAFTEMGNVALQGERNDAAAVAAFESALKFAPDAGGAALALGTLKAEKGDAKAAKSLFERAAKTLPDGKLRASAFACLGRIAEESKNTRAARDAYASALKLDPLNPWAARALDRLSRAEATRDLSAPKK